MLISVITEKFQYMYNQCILSFMLNATHQGKHTMPSIKPAGGSNNMLWRCCTYIGKGEGQITQQHTEENLKVKAKQEQLQPKKHQE